MVIKFLSFCRQPKLVDVTDPNVYSLLLQTSHYMPPEHSLWSVIVVRALRMHLLALKRSP